MIDVRFQYSLESVLEYRKKIEDSKKDKFMNANKQFAHETSVLSGIEEHRNQIREDLKAKDTFSIQEQKNYMQYIMSLEKKMEMQKIRVSDSKRRCDLARGELVKAQKDRKIMETLEGKELDKYNYDLKRKEEIEANEMASINYIRRKHMKE